MSLHNYNIIKIMAGRKFLKSLLSFNECAALMLNHCDTFAIFEKAAKTSKKGIEVNWIEQHVQQAEPPLSSAAVMKHHFSV